MKTTYHDICGKIMQHVFKQYTTCASFKTGKQRSFSRQRHMKSYTQLCPSFCHRTGSRSSIKQDRAQMVYGYKIACFPIISNLVVEKTPLKDLKVSWDDDYSQSMEKHMFQTTNQINRDTIRMRNHPPVITIFISCKNQQLNS